MSSSSIRAALLGTAIALLATGVSAQVETGKPIQLKAPKKKIAKFKCEVLSMTNVQIIVRSRDNERVIRTFTYTPEMREKLKLGMQKSQVHYVLGTPMISDAFHDNRWDYVYRLERNCEIVEKQRLTLHFDGDNLVKIDDGKTVETAPVIAKQATDPPTS
ncbi:MAG: outer membrane protein assembly factor BamE, partial [Chloroflexota bacterium]